MRNRRDDLHSRATDVLRSHAGEELATTNHVRGETWTFLRNRVGHPAARNFVESLARSPRTRVLFVTEELEDVAVRWLFRHDERPYSFVDATSFAVMRELGIDKVMTFDSDFEAAGYRVLSS